MKHIAELKKLPPEREKVKEEAKKIYRKELIELLFEQPYSKSNLWSKN